MRILIADDNEINRDFLCAVLESQGHLAVTARDGREAVAACEAARFDVVLMDIRMPRVDGLEATARIRLLAGYDEVPVLALTADLQARQRERLLERGFAVVLLKPVSRADLLAAIAAALGRGDDRGGAAEDGAGAGPERSDGAPAAAPIDAPAALRAAGGNPELMRRLTAMLAREIAAFRPRIASAIAAGAADDARELVHKLRASAGFCGAHVLRDRAADLEEALRTDPDGAGPAHAAFASAADALAASLGEPD